MGKWGMEEWGAATGQVTGPKLIQFAGRLQITCPLWLSGFDTFVFPNHLSYFGAR
jgi:hypothetical protein